MPRLDYRSGTSDTATSSSGNESIQFGPSRTPSPAVPAQVTPSYSHDNDDLSDAESEIQAARWEEYEPPVTPHKVLKLRRLVFEVLHCALTIIYETQKHELPLVPDAAGKGRPRKKGQTGSEVVRLDVKEPWMRLSRVVAALRSAISGLKEDDKACKSCLNTFTVVVTDRILPLTEDRGYVRSLARNEAKAIPSLLKAWDKIAPALISDSEIITFRDHLSLAMDTCPIVLLRLTHHSLLSSPVDPLDMSGLSIQVGNMDELDLCRLAEATGIDMDEIKEVNMSQNGWKRMPDWSPFAFPNITTLDLTSNTNLSYLPLSLLRTPITKIHCRATLLLNTDLPLVRSISSSISSRIRNSRGPPTLLYTVLRLYTTLIRPHYPLSALDSLPPRLAELISGTYTCELCLEIVTPSDLGNRWMKDEVERGWAVEGRSVTRQIGNGAVRERWVATKVVRVKGRVCGDCKDRYLRPLPVEYG